MEADKNIDPELLNIYNRDNYYQISRVNPLLKLHLKKVRNKKALDIGCGNGVNSRYMLERGYEVLGIDINTEALRLAESLGTKVENTDIRNFRGWQKYDLIISFYSLQHMSAGEAIQVLITASEHLNRDGIIIIGIFVDRENGITANDVRQILCDETKFQMLEEDEWVREDNEHGSPHLHKGYYCVCRKG